MDAEHNTVSNADVLVAPKRVSRIILYIVILVIWLLLQFNLTPQKSSLVLRDLGTGASTTTPTRIGTRDPPITSLIKLTQSYRKVKCPPSLVFVNDTLLDPLLAFADGRKIPRIVHISSGSRCNDKIIAKNLDTWRLKDHFFFLHDDDAVLGLLNQDWPEFPLLKHISKCFPEGMGATWIDLWRLLVLWKYGGIYADMDTSPVPYLFNESTISPDDDAFFVVDQTGGPSQWFMAASPNHPMIYLSVFGLIVNVMNQDNLGKFRVVFTTGPGAVMQGFTSFTRNKNLHWNSPAGLYVGAGNRTVTLVGNRSNENLYITRVIKPLLSNSYKHMIYQKTNMSHLTETPGTVYKPQAAVDESCLTRLYRLERERMDSIVQVTTEQS